MKKTTYSLLCAACLGGSLICGPALSAAETPGQFRPKSIPVPEEKAFATGEKYQPTDTLPVSRAPVPYHPAQRKPKLAHPGQPAIKGSEITFNAGWEMIEARRLGAVSGAALSQPGVHTQDWYDATVPGTVLTTLVDQGVYPDPYFGLDNLVIPESLHKQDYWYRAEFTVPENFSGRELWLQFNGINYYAEIWLNGNYLGSVAGAFLRGQFDVTCFIQPGATNALAVMIAPPPNPGVATEQSVKFGSGDNGGKLCLDSPTFECADGWDWIPGVRDRCIGLWQDVTLRATGPVTIGDPQVITRLPLPDTSRADITIQTELANASSAEQRGVLKGSFEGVAFEQPVTLRPGETRTVAFAPRDFPQLAVPQPRLWWPNGYGKPELYHLQLTFITDGQKTSDEKSLRFGIRELTYEMGVKQADGQVARFEYTPSLLPASAPPVIDNRRDSMLWGVENTAKRAAATGIPPSDKPFWWGQGQETTVALWPGRESSPALKPVPDTGLGRFLVIKVNGRPIECLGGNWGMDDAMKRVSRERLEPCLRLSRDANMNMIRNWAGQSTSEAFYDLCDEYGILVWNDFWLNTEGNNYRAADHERFLRNVTDSLKRFRTHPSIALWCPGNECVAPEDLNTAMDQLVRQLDGTRYYQPNSRLVNLCNSGPWSNMPLVDYFQRLNAGFSTELGASSIPSLEVVRTIIPEADLWPYNDVWAYHDLHSKGAGDRKSTFERIAARYGEPESAADLCRKAQMLNYETFRAIYEGVNSKLWRPCSGVVVWMSHPSWASLIWQFYTWDYDPNASLFGAKKGAEPVHIQMNLPDCKIAVVNRQPQPLTDVTASAEVYNLAGTKILNHETKLTVPVDACVDAFPLDWPANDCHFARLELRDAQGRLLSQNFYWHARNENDLRQLNTLPPATVTGQCRVQREAGETVVTGTLTNTGKVPALAARLTLRDAASGQRILPVYYQDNYLSLLPGETRDFRITCPASAGLLVDVDGWNVKSSLRP